MKAIEERVTTSKLYHKPTVYFFISFKDEWEPNRKIWCKKACLDAAGAAGFFSISCSVFLTDCKCSLPLSEP